MPTWSTLWAFVAASAALLLIPGPAVFYVLNRSIADGRSVGLAAVGGLEVGDAVQAAAAAVGLSAVLATSATAFTAVKWAGATYLIVTGVRTLMTRPTAERGEAGAVTAQRAFRQGIVVNALNPKTALFFLSIFPQFIDPRRGSATRQSLVLGAVFVVLATLFNGTYSLIASSLRDRLLRGRSVPFMQRYVSGVLYIALGVAAALSSHSRTTTAAATTARPA